MRCYCRGLVSLQASAGAKPGNPCATPSTTSKHARQLPFTSGTPMSSRLSEQAMAYSPARSLQKQTASCSPITSGLCPIASGSCGLSFPEQATVHSPTAPKAVHRGSNSPTLSLPKQATLHEPAASGALLMQCDSPALSLPDQATLHSPDENMSMSDDAIGRVEQSDISPQQQGINRKDEAAAEEEEQGLEAYVLSDLWKIFVQQMGQAGPLLVIDLLLHVTCIHRAACQCPILVMCIYRAACQWQKSVFGLYKPTIHAKSDYICCSFKHSTDCYLVPSADQAYATLFSRSTSCTCQVTCIGLHGWCLRQRVYALSSSLAFIPEQFPVAWTSASKQGVKLSLLKNVWTYVSCIP